MKRRSFLSLSAAALAAPALLPRRALAAGTDIGVQLGWIANVEYGDHWVALEEGLFDPAGLNVKVMPGGPNAPSPLTMVSGGQAQVGYGSWLPFLDAVAQGNDFVMIAARFQTSPLGILSLAKKPILTPEDILGSRILAQGAAEDTAIKAVLGMAGLDKDGWTNVPAGFSPEPLVAGDGDGYTAFATNQLITLEKMGLVKDKDFFFRSFDDLGFPGYAGLAFVERKFLDANRPALVAYTAALMKAWGRIAQDPAYPAKLAVEKYGQDYGLDIDQQIRQSELQLPFVWPGMDMSYPIFELDPVKMAGPMYDAARATGRTNVPDIRSIADIDLAAEARELL